MKLRACRSCEAIGALKPPIAGSQREGEGGGGGVLEPWSPGALKFLLWSPGPDHFTDWSPDTFLAVEPGAQRNFARSPEPSIFKFDHSSSQIALILDYCLFVLFVRVNGHKETESEESTVHNTSKRGYLVYNDMQQLI